MEYRSKYCHDTERPYYSIERFRNGKWRFCFAEFDKSMADFLVKNPSLIELERKKYKAVGICVLIFMIISITYLIIIS